MNFLTQPMANLQGLGDIQTDLKSIFSILPGNTATTATNKFNELIAFIREQAKQGALEAVPTIKTEVKTTVTPYVMTALVMGGLGLIFGLVAISRTKKG